MNSSVLYLGNYSVGISDLLSLAALVISVFAAWGAVSAARSYKRMIKIENERDSHHRRRDLARTLPRAEIIDVMDDNEGPGPQRHIQLQLSLPEDGTRCEVYRCEVAKPRSFRLEIRFLEQEVRGEHNEVRFPNPMELGARPITFSVVQHFLASAGGVTKLVFHGQRYDAAFSPFRLELQIGPGRRIASPYR